MNYFFNNTVADILKLVPSWSFLQNICTVVVGSLKAILFGISEASPLYPGTVTPQSETPEVTREMGYMAHVFTKDVIQAFNGSVIVSPVCPSIDKEADGCEICESTEPNKSGAVCAWVIDGVKESVLTLCDAKTVFARFMASFLNESGTFGDWTAINNCNTNAMSVFI